MIAIASRLVASTIALFFAVPAIAAPGGEWQISPYIWIAGFDGTVGGSGGDPDTGSNADFSHLWDNLGLAGAMVNVSWRRERWTAFGDWTYASVESDSSTRVPALYDSVEGQIKGHVMQAFAGWDLAPSEDSHLDVFAGARYYNLDLSVDITGAALPDVELQGDDDWVDAVAGLRWTRRFAKRWRSYLQGDAGAGGSDLSWQVMAGAGYDFGWGTFFGGYRYLHVDRGDGAYQLDAALTGPFIGASFAM